MNSEDGGCFGRYFRNVSQQKLILLGVTVIGIIVIIILLFTLLLAPDNSSHNKLEEFSGHDVLKIVPLIDGYNSLPASLWDQLNGKINDFKFDQDLKKDKSYEWLRTDLPRLKQGMVGCQVWTVKSKCTSQSKDAVALTLQQIDAIIRLNKKFSSEMKIAYSSEDVDQIYKEGKIGSILSIDGGHSIDNKLSVLRLYYTLGIRYISLTSECDTPWSTSYKTSGTSDLTAFGESVIKEMNRIGMIIDLSQSSEAVQKKTIAISAAPVIFSSSAVYNYRSKSPNIKDDVLNLIKQHNGLVMITFNTNLIRKSSTETISIESVVEQINYVRTKIGSDYVGIGSGFGTSTSFVNNLEDSSKFPALFDRLAKPEKDEPKWSKEDLQKLAGLNFLRVFKEVERVRDENQNTIEATIPNEDLKNFDVKCYSDLKS